MPGPFVAVLLGALVIYTVADEKTKRRMDEWTKKMAYTLFGEPVELLTQAQQQRLLSKVEDEFSEKS